MPSTAKDNIFLGKYKGPVLVPSWDMISSSNDALGIFTHFYLGYAEYIKVQSNSPHIFLSGSKDD